MNKFNKPFRTFHKLKEIFPQRPVISITINCEEKIKNLQKTY